MTAIQFDLAAQDKFARYSADYNPMHVDPLYSRRTMAGQPVVHGVNILLSAAEAASAAGLLPLGRPATIKASFKRPLLLGERADIEVQQGATCRIRVNVGRALLAVFDVELVEGPPVVGGVATVAAEPASPKSTAFEALVEGQEGDYPVACARDAIFPLLEKAWGRSTIAVLASHSTLVGMEIPGLESMLSEIVLKFDGSPIADAMRYSVARSDERFRKLELVVTGAGFHGKTVAFSPQARVAQPSASEVAAIVTQDYRRRHALVVGGSRGLGEVIAKTIAGGGGRVTITYANGREEAERVAAEINAAAGEALASTMRLDVNENVDASPLRDMSGFADVTSVYYMATPQIFVERRKAFDPALLARFNRFYVDFPAELIDRMGGDGVRRAVMWPSSVAVETAPPGAAEYVVAKAAGEKMVELAAKIWPNLRFIVDRLPRIATDQTIVLSPTEAAEVLTVIPDLVRRTETLIEPRAA